MSSGSRAPRERAQRLAQVWARALHGTSFAVMDTAAMMQMLRDLSGRVIEALDRGAEGRPALHDVGRSLVEAHFVERGVLEIVLDRLRAETVERAGEPAPHLAIMTGYIDAFSDRVRREQEQVAASALTALAEIDHYRWISEARFAAVFADSPVGIGIADAKGIVVEVNRALCEMFGMAAEEFIGRSVYGFVHPDDGPQTWPQIDEILLGKIDHLRTAKSYRRPDGGSLHTELALTLIRDTGGTPRHLVGVLIDVTARAQLEQQLRHEASHDPLTGLANRALLMSTLVDAVRADTAAGLCFLDLDGFKTVNDTLGHSAGDELLRTVAQALAADLEPDGHLVARMGGDEFMVLVVRGARSDTGDVADRIRAIVARPMSIDGREVFVTASVGVVSRRAGGGAEQMDATELVKAADSTLHRAKRAGRRRSVDFDVSHHRDNLVRSARSRRLAEALDHGEFDVHFQPLVRLADGRVAGFEALVRWRDRDGTLLLPDTFVPLAEESGLIVPLGRWVLEHSCRSATAWRDADPDVFLSVNLATRQLREEGLVDDVRRILATTGWPATALQLEITESDAVGTCGREVDALHELAGLGIRIAVDDFGTGYSNFAYLRRLPVHVLKLAGPFVTGHEEPGTGAGRMQPADDAADVDTAVLAHVVGLAHTLGLSVTAEHVESAEQERRLQELGCDLGQGWFYGRPTPLDATIALLDGGDRTGRTRPGAQDERGLL